MAEIRKDDIDRLRERVKRDAKKYPALAEMLLAELPEDYDPAAAPVELGVPDALATSTAIHPSDQTTQLAAAKIRRSLKVEAVDQARDQFMDEARILNEKLMEGRVSPLIWNSEMMDLVKDLHVSAYVSGKSGEWGSMTYADWGRVGAIVKKQYAFLRNWAQDLYDLEGTSLAKLNARAQLYAEAASQSLSAGMLSEIGIDAGALPAHPGDGTTSCRARCRCRWSIRIHSKSRGDYDASWRMGSAEHCIECRKRARAWVSLRVRGGVIIDEYEDIRI